MQCNTNTNAVIQNTLFTLSGQAGLMQVKDSEKTSANLAKFRGHNDNTLHYFPSLPLHLHQMSNAWNSQTFLGKQKNKKQDDDASYKEIDGRLLINSGEQ